MKGIFQNEYFYVSIVVVVFVAQLIQNTVYIGVNYELINKIVDGYTYSDSAHNDLINELRENIDSLEQRILTLETKD